MSDKVSEIKHALKTMVTKSLVSGEDISSQKRNSQAAATAQKLPLDDIEIASEKIGVKNTNFNQAAASETAKNRKS